MARRMFYAGDPAPWFSCRSSVNPGFHFNTAAGRYLVLSFFGSADNPTPKAVLAHVTGPLRERFNDTQISFFGVSIDPADESETRVPDLIPGIRYFYDFDRSTSLLYGALDPEEASGAGLAYHP